MRASVKVGPGLFPFAALALVVAACAAKAPPPPAVVPPRMAVLGCPADMVLAGDFCMDRYEAYVVEVDAHGNERAHSPFEVVDGLKVRAKNTEGVFPQAYISQVQARAACADAGKRLCTADEFEFACSGGSPKDNDYPYGGHVHMPGYCNEGKGSQMVRFFGPDAHAWTSDNFNDPRLNQAPGSLAKTGAFPKCVSAFGVHDCVGNLHEWGSDPPDKRGTCRFRGGFYGDAEVNGHGCKYVTQAHGPGYHDYSTGFRCCADASAT
jgi:formylglycine-generating enzyme required for sulfatase activity